jgi:integrase
MDMTVKQLPNRTYYYRFHIGKVQYRKQGFRTRDEAEKAEALKKADAIRRESCNEDFNNDLRLADAADMFFEEYSVPQKKTWKSDRAHIRVMKRFFGEKKIRDITPRQVEAFRSYVKKNVRNIRGELVNLHSVNHYHATLKAIINWAKKKRLYHGENPAWGIDMAVVPKARVRFLLPVEEKRLTPAVAKYNRLWPYYLMALHTGMRVSEICDIRVKDVMKHPKPMVFIRNSKSRRSRYVPLSPRMMELLEPRVKGKDPERILFDGYRPRTVSLWFSDACRDAKIPEFSFHCLRHTFASHMLGKGVPIYHVSKIMGHSTVRVTEEHYGHLERGILNREIHNIESVLTFPEIPKINA